MEFWPSSPLEIVSTVCYSLQGGSSSKLFASIVPAVPAARSSDHGRVAQLAEHSALNRQVEGSIPSASTIKSSTYTLLQNRAWSILVQTPREIYVPSLWCRRLSVDWLTSGDERRLPVGQDLGRSRVQRLQAHSPRSPACKHPRSSGCSRGAAPLAHPSASRDAEDEYPAFGASPET